MGKRIVDGACRLVAVIAVAFAAGCEVSTEPTMKSVSLKFNATFGDESAACGQMYDGVGMTGESVEVYDLRFYVSNIRLVTAEGDEVAVELEQDGRWQYETVALLDFENGEGNCGETGTTDMNDTVSGMVPEGTYTGIVFDLGVPFEMNHDDLAAAEAPLNVGAMYWAWAIGHKFVRVDLQTEAGMRWNMHLGSTMCSSDGPTSPPVEACARPNLPTIRLSSFDDENDTILFDVAALLSASDLTSDTEDTASGCQAFPDDVNECMDLFPKLGLDFTTGRCINDCMEQEVFRIAP